MAYTIKEIADLAGISTRTLRYYDEIGLLPPAAIMANGYRQYDRQSLLLLQQIRFYREFEIPLAEIQLILNQPDFNLEDALKSQKKHLENRKERLDILILTIEKTLENMKGNNQMAVEELFDGFREEEYEDETRERWGKTDEYKESRRRWSSYSDKMKQSIKDQNGKIFSRMVGGLHSIVTDADVQQAVGDYYTHLTTYFYDCEPGFLKNLADMWVNDPRFSAVFEKIRPGGAAFAREAVHHYVNSKS